MKLSAENEHDVLVAAEISRHLAWTKYGPMDLWGFPLEITSGAITPAGHADLFRLQANTSAGLWDLHAIPRARLEHQELRRFLESFERRHRTAPFRWRKASSSFVLGGETEPPLRSDESSSHPDSLPSAKCSSGHWATSSEDLLQRLRDSSLSARELAEVILFAEVTTFDEAQIEELLPLLFSFVERHRFSCDEEILVAVGSAIRKFIMSAPQVDFDRYAELLRPSATETLSCEIELEFCKAILWRLTVEPPVARHALANLTVHLREIADDYLSPRLILQKNYAAIVLNSVLAALVLTGDRCADLVQRIRDLELKWFAELFYRRLRKLERDLLAQGTAGATQIVADLQKVAPHA